MDGLHSRKIWLEPTVSFGYGAVSSLCGGGGDDAYSSWRDNDGTHASPPSIHICLIHEFSTETATAL